MYDFFYFLLAYSTHLRLYLYWVFLKEETFDKLSGRLHKIRDVGNISK